MPEPAYKLDDLIVEDPAEKAKAQQFECSICMGLLHDPVQTSCGHLFCSDCFRDDLEACPMCRDSLAKRPQKVAEVNPFVSRMIGTLKVRCPFAEQAEKAVEALGEEGPEAKRRRTAAGSGSSGGLAGAPCCSWTGTFGDFLSKHVLECPEKLVECPKGCGVQFQRKHAEAHASECVLNLVACKICGAMVPPADMPKHMKDAAESHVGVLEEKLEAAKGESEIHARLVKLEARLDAAAAGQKTHFLYMLQDVTAKLSMPQHTGPKCVLKDDRSEFSMEVHLDHTAYPGKVAIFFRYAGFGLLEWQLFGKTGTDQRTSLQTFPAGLYDFKTGMGYTDAVPLGEAKKYDQWHIVGTFQPVSAAAV